MTYACPKSFIAFAHGRGGRALLATAGLLVAGAATAADFSVGVGAGADRGHVDCVASFPCDRQSGYFKVDGAYRFNEAFDVQAVFFEAGRFKGGDTTPLGTEFGGTFKTSGLGVTAGYRWTFAPSWSLIGRAGVASMRTRFDYASPFSGSVSETTTQPLLGIGVAYAVTPTIHVGLDYDVTRLKVYKTRGSLQMLGVAAQFSF